MTFLKNSLTADLIRRMTVLFFLSLLLFGLFYRFIFPTYYYWQLERPVKQAQKFIEKNQTERLSKEIIVVKEPDFAELSEEELNNHLSFLLDQSGVTLNKFWLDQNTQQKLMNGETIQRLYHQSKLRNDFYSLFFVDQGELYLVGRSIPSFHEAVGILFPVLFLITIFFLLLMIGFLVFYVRKELILPIRKMERATRQMSALNFNVDDLRTKNELGMLGDSMNQMANALQEYENKMLTRNEQLQDFSSNLAHELKTPVAIMQLLIDAEKMSLNSPTFLEELDQQLVEIDRRISQMLAYSTQLKEEVVFSDVSLDTYVEKLRNHYQQLDTNTDIIIDIEPQVLKTNEPLIALIFGNLITNAMKYSTDQKLLINGKKVGENYLFSFTNTAEKINQDLLKKLTEPFVVGETSRNSYLSGTGLGLTIVRQAVEKLGGEMSIEQQEKIFCVIISLPI